MAIGGPQNGGDETEGGEGGGGIFADINITPLTDIFLVLLIIFMVTTTAIASQDKGGFKVNLPRGQKGDAGIVPRDLVVAILVDGRAVIGGKVLDKAELAETFEASARLNPDTVLVVQADAGVAHGRVVDVMEAARAAGLTKLAIATQIEGVGERPH